MVHTEGENDRVEVWKDYKNYYQVSNFGRIFSKRYNKIMKPTLNAYGYYRICIYDSPKHFKNELVHRIVAQAFIPNPDNLPEVNHRDENPQNNFVSNLEWCSAKYNSNFGTRNKRIGKSNSKKVLQYTLDGEFVREWQSTMECGRNGFNQGHVAECCRGERKTHKDFIWKYK